MSYPQRVVVVSDEETARRGYAALRRKLYETPGSVAAVDRWMRYEHAAVRLTTAVLGAVYPERHFVAVQYRTSSQAVPPFSARGLSEDKQQSARADGIRASGPARKSACTCSITA